MKIQLGTTDKLPLLEIVLKNRNVKVSAEDFLNLSWDDVQSPHDIENLERIADKIHSHLKNSEKIAIIVDSDTDGFTSAALLVNYLELQKEVGYEGSWEGNNPEFVFLFHEGKTHGLSNTTIMKDLRDNIKPDLLIIPDASGTDEQYKALNDLGIEIVVLDHHDTSNKGDNEKTIVANPYHSKDYKNKALSGVGVVFQLCRIFDQKMIFETANKWLDLVAVGLVADVMDLRSKETRFLVQEGLKEENIRLPFLVQARVLDTRVSNDIPYNPKRIGFNIAPLFNAVNRISPIEEKKFIFYSLLDNMALEEVDSGKRVKKSAFDEFEEKPKVLYVDEAIRQASNAKGRQDSRKKKMAGLIDEMISDEKMYEDKVIIIPIDDFNEDQRALGGVTAAALADGYQRPCILLFKDKVEPGAEVKYSGSLRAPSNVEAFLNFRTQCEESRLCTYVMGHQQAAGVGIKGENIGKLRAYFNEKYKEISSEILYQCDFLFDANDPALPDAIFEIAHYKNLWGQGIEEPLIAITGVLLSSQSLFLCGQRKSTLKISLPNGVSCITHKSSQEEHDSLIIPYDGKVEERYLATIVGKASVNEYGGRVSPQIDIESFEVQGTTLNL
ncbi:DHH family phosphoesterase [Massilibacteroides sp.]|uniref:DHH family phosphoesterase n=1 Tax=Massilibacteroides sp. TaxID=2034766 RepID=UPI00260B5AF3|nr:DHH family phosphoesterase [Massilibacteroides sp.]MDD4516361.1 DHH family phosphoesterase [Massilibacteroides sp.]